MKQEMKFEAALERLEQIVSRLEEGTLSLDEALKRYEEGVMLARLCSKQLSEAEKKIEILTKSLGGELQAASFEFSEKEDLPASKIKGKGKKRADAGSQNEDEESRGDLPFDA